MKVFLLGLPGSGKTTLGKELAQVMKMPFVDLDEEIELSTGKSITTIFAEEGELNFRKKELDQLIKWSSQPSDFVMATGGGTPCFFDNLKEIKKSGISVFLDVPIAEIVHRMNPATASTRPLLENPAGLGVTLHELLLKRRRFYEQATYTIQGDQLSAGQVRKLITS